MDLIQRRGWQIGSLVALIAAVVVSIAAALIILASRAQFINMFANMGKELPVITNFALAPASLLVLPALAVFLVAKEFLPIEPRTKAIVNLIGLAVAMSLQAVYVMALFAPMHAMMESVSQ